MFSNLLKKAKDVIKKSSNKKEDTKNQKADLSYKENSKPKVNIGIRG